MPLHFNPIDCVKVERREVKVYINMNMNMSGSRAADLEHKVRRPGDDVGWAGTFAVPRCRQHLRLWHLRVVTAAGRVQVRRGIRRVRVGEDLVVIVRVDPATANLKRMSTSSSCWKSAEVQKLNKKYACTCTVHNYKYMGCTVRITLIINVMRKVYFTEVLVHVISTKSVSRNYYIR